MSYLFAYSFGGGSFKFYFMPVYNNVIYFNIFALIQSYSLPWVEESCFNEEVLFLWVV